jgi:rod shape-determining protein MreD
VTALRVVAAGVMALVLQGLLTRLVGAPSMRVDLGLVAVVWIALRFGRVPGLLGGTLVGLGQDALGGGILGLAGLAKSVAGFATGIIGTQFIVTQTVSRLMVFVGATLLHALVFVGLSTLLGLKTPPDPSLDVAIQSLSNAVVGLFLFQVFELTPGARALWRARRERLKRRQKRRYH